MTVVKTTGTETMRVTRNIRDKGVAEWLQTVPEDVLVALREEAELGRGWDERFAGSQDALGDLVKQARDEVARGDVSPFDPSNRPRK